jgi:ABC-type polysaccharide/polyol phosphate transport system ATPase subunit
MPIIELKDVWEMYRIKFIVGSKPSWENFWALRGISFSMEKGQILGIIGENGSGKSTVLRLIAGMLKPDRGQIKVSGSVSGLLELGAGFQPELTGRENVSLQFELFGLGAAQAKEKFQRIIDFAEIGKFIDAPVKCYSQGMFVRLAFAIAVHMDSDIFLVDDTLAVGDEYFQKKCIQEIFKIKQKGRTVIVVTHDMAMLQKLCPRTIFLKQGMLVKDAETAKAVSFYSQTVGSPKGIAIIEKQQLSLVFNNGKLLLNWDGKLFTNPGGAYTIFSAANKWYSSAQAEWEISQPEKDAFTAIGKFYSLGLTQIWRIEAAGESGIKWDIEMETDKDIELSEMYVNIALKDEYRKWFAGSEKGDFPLIKNEDKNWSPIFTKNGLSACLGVEREVLKSGELPSLIFEQLSLGYSTQGLILNSDYLSGCRVLQYRLNPSFNKSANQADRFICFAGKILADTPDLEGYLSKSQKEFVLSTPALSLIFDNGQGILDYKGADLNKHNHISTSVCVNGRWHFSNFGHWEIKTQGNNKIVYTGTWPGLPLMQIWEIEITGERSFIWKVNMQVNEEVGIEQQHCCLCGSQDYICWFSRFGEGKFPNSFLESEIDMVQRCIPDGEIGMVSEKSGLPALSVKFADAAGNFAKIMNSDFYARERILRIEKVEPEEAVRFLPGNYPCFRLEVVLDRAKRAYPENFNILREKKIKVVFNNGRGHIFWDGNELTKRLGLYTSLRLNGRWHDSMSSAQWRIEENKNGVIKAFGKWLYLPVSQFWQIRLLKTGTLEFKVSMDTDQEIKADRLQTNLMVSERYSRWLKDGKEYPFPEFDNQVDDEWEVIHSAKNGKSVGVTDGPGNKFSWPSITFLPDKIKPAGRLNIVNSDIYHRGRVLQYLDIDKTLPAGGDYAYFSGKFVIGK